MKRILVIEDNQELLENIVELLELSEYQVFTAINGNLGFEQALAHHPDLIISDIMMPEMDGYGVLELVQSHEELKNIPFIFLSAKSEKVDLRKGMALGADDYLTKPFETADLFNAVETRLKKAEEARLQQQALLQQEKAQNQQVLQTLIENQEKEQRQLSITLRDYVGQTLTSCKLMMEVAGEGGAQAQQLTQKSCQSLNEMIQEVRNISYDLAPSALHDVGLTEAVSAIVETINANKELQVSFTHTGMQQNGDLNHSQGITVYRMIQELINNILRHAHATKAAVHLNRKGKQLQLTVEDNGVGFDAEHTPKGTGLNNLQSRLDLYKGTLNLYSAPGRGTKVEVVLNELLPA